MTNFKSAGAQSKRTIAVLTMAVTAMLLSGCAAQQIFRFSPRSVTKVNYDPKQCTPMSDGRIKCKEVYFTVATIDVSQSK